MNENVDRSALERLRGRPGTLEEEYFQPHKAVASLPARQSSTRQSSLSGGVSWRIRYSRLIAVAILALLLPLGLVELVGPVPVAHASTAPWSPTGSMSTPHSAHTATLLPNGQVLVAGGFNNNTNASAELYNPNTGNWALIGSMGTVRAFHTATLLPSGQVLVAGGEDLNGTPLASAELYNPSTGSWSSTGSMNMARFYHTATLLPNGQVLVAGGQIDTSGTSLASAELYNPSTGSWSSTGSMNIARSAHTATLLSNGQVLVAGGGDSSTSGFASAELYNPSTGSWSFTGSMNIARAAHTATLLPNGQVLVAGGANNSFLASTELYAPSTGTWSLTGSMNASRYNHTATLLSNGQVLVAGGLDSSNNAIASAELYDPGTGKWASTGSMGTARAFHTATSLSNGKVLVAGGGDSFAAQVIYSSAELYTWDTTPPVLSLPASPLTVNATSPQGASISYTVSATDPDNPPNQLTVTCSPTSGSIFPIGTTTVNCKANDPAGNTANGSFQVVVKQVLTTSATGVSVREGSTFGGAMATGTAYTSGTLSASISWGDGSSSTGTVTRASNGSYSVNGSHSYSEEGSFALKVTVTDSGGLQATGSGSASVSDAALTAAKPTAVISGEKVTVHTNFTDADPKGTVTDYHGMIKWGDGTTTSGTIGKNSSGKGFTATGTHTYSKHGTYTAILTISDAGGSSVQATITLKV